MAKPYDFDVEQHQLHRAQQHIAFVESERDRAITQQNQALQAIDDFLADYYDGMKLDVLVRKVHQERERLKHA